MHYAYHGALDFNRWKHIAVVFDGTRMKGYSNGAEESNYAADPGGASHAGDGLLMVGRYYSGECSTEPRWTHREV